MLKRILGALTSAVLVLSIPLASLAVERYEVLQVGDEDSWVMELQEKLNDLGYLNVPATGYFGTNTQNAVVRYQQEHGLTADGKAGPQTRKSIFGDDYKEITGPRTPGIDDSIIVKPSSTTGDVAESTPTPSPGGEPGSAVPTAAPSSAPSSAPTQQPDEGDRLQLGDKGDAVSELQQKLADFGYYTYGSITGYFGPVTEDAVKKFQNAYGLEETGTIGSAEKAILDSSTVEQYSLRQGDSNDNVRRLQERLIALGYMSSSATGYFGRVTKQALIDFQSNNGLPTDGVGTAAVLNKVYSSDAKRADGSPAGDSNAPQPTIEPTVSPTSAPEPTDAPSDDPSAEPTAAPDTPDDPSADPTDAPEEPSADPTDAPEEPSADPTDTPDDPSADPTDAPDDPDEPSAVPSAPPVVPEPTDEPAADPTAPPVIPDPTDEPSADPTDEPDDPDDPDEPDSSSIETMLEVAESQIGKPYVYGASGPNSFDCSGYVYYVLKGSGVSISRQSAAGYCANSSWPSVKSRDDLRTGDLVFFKSDSSSAISHVGIYVGGGNFIHSAPSIDGVGYSTMASGYYSRNYVSARRVF